MNWRKTSLVDRFNPSFELIVGFAACLCDMLGICRCIIGDGVANAWRVCRSCEQSDLGLVHPDSVSFNALDIFIYSQL